MTDPLAPRAPTTVATARGPVELASFGEGATIVALHGAMGGWEQSAILALTVGAPGFRYLAVSRPGYLGTPLSSGSGPEEQADLVAALLDALDVEAAAVMGISGGGPAALCFAHRHPGRCWALLPISTVSGTLENRIPLSFKIMTLLARFGSFERLMLRRLEKAPEQAAARSIPDPDLLARTVADPEVWPLFRRMLVATMDRMRLRLDGTANDIAISSSCTYPLEEIAVPVLAVHGTADEMVPYDEHARRLAERIPGAQLLTIEDGRHVTIFTHRHVVQERVAAFLRQHAPASSAG